MAVKPLVNPSEQELRDAIEAAYSSSSASTDALPELTLPEDDFEYDPEAVAAMGANAGIMSAESTAAALRASTEAGQVATGRTASNALLAAAIAGESQRSLQDSATESLHRQMSALDPGWRATVASAAAATNTSVDNIAQYMASYAPQMLSMGADLAETHGKIAQSLMEGKIPEDVYNMVRTGAAEAGQAHGLFGTAAGGAGRAMEARDLGLVGLQLQQAGAGMARDNAGLWSSHALQLANMGGAAQTLAKGQTDLLKSIIPEVDIAPIYDTTSKMLQASNVVSADTVFQGSLDQYNRAMGWGISMYQTEREAQAQYDSMSLQYQADVYGYQSQVSAARAAANAAVGAANAQSAGLIGAAQAESASLLGVAEFEAKALVDVANIESRAVVDAARATAAPGLEAAKTAAKESAEKLRLKAEDRAREQARQDELKREYEAQWW
jgi:hypothetical protein